MPSLCSILPTSCLMGVSKSLLLTQTFVCSGTVKFGHVTFVWNGNRSGQFSKTLEKYVEIPSDQGIDKKPEMKAIAIASKAAEALRSGEWDHVRLFPRSVVYCVPRCLMQQSDELF